MKVSRLPHHVIVPACVLVLLCCYSDAFAFNDRMVTRGIPTSGEQWSGVSALLTYIEGSLGALIMVLAGLGSIFVAGYALGARSLKLGLGSLLLVAVATGTFMLRSFVVSFKPVIYLYPQNKTDVSVRLDYAGELTVTYPKIDPQTNAWKVIAEQSGKLIDLRDQRPYSYLFWEGRLPTGTYRLPESGFVVRGEESARFLQDFLEKAGLLPTEYNEFIVYWYPLIKDFPYVRIALAGGEYEKTAQLKITPTPDSLLRVFLYFKRLEAPE